MRLFLNYYLFEAQGKKKPEWRDEKIWYKAKRASVHAFGKKIPSLKRKISKALKEKGKKKLKELGKKKVDLYIKDLDNIAKKGKLPGYPQMKSIYQFIMAKYKEWGGTLKNP